MKTLPRFILSLAVSAACASHVRADTSVATDPVGFVTIKANAGTGTSKVVSVLSIPLLDIDPNITGQSVGRITGITSNSISNSSADWAAGALSVPATPYIVQITSGLAKGRIFEISTVSANTSTSVVIDSEDASKTDLSSLGIVVGASGDTYAIYKCDTIASAFGAPVTTGVVGSTSSAGADVLQLFESGAWSKFYYSTATNSWLRVGVDSPANDIAIRPDSGVIYSRLANTDLKLTFLGKVPVVDRKAPIAKSGVTFIANSFPVDTTLSASGFTSIPGWVANPDSSLSDVAQMFVQGAWTKYYNDGVNWRVLGIGALSDDVPIPAGTAVILSKKGSISGYTTYSQVLPYSL